MKNRLFDEKSMAVTLMPEHWRVVSSLYDEEVDFIQNPAHLKWMSLNTERHQAREVLFALKGNGIFGYRDRVYPCPPGTVFLLNAYESHDRGYPPVSEEIMHLWLTLFDHDIVASVVKSGVGRIGRLALSDDPAARLFSRTWDELREVSTLPPEFRRAKLIAAISALLMRIVEGGFGRTESHSEANFQKQVIDTICRHMARTAGRDVALAEAARLSGYSKFYFLRLFKQATGQTFHEYVDSCRRKKVDAMLREGQTKTEISETLGFSHPSTFLRWMRTHKQRNHKEV